MFILRDSMVMYSCFIFPKQYATYVDTHINNVKDVDCYTFYNSWVQIFGPSCIQLMAAPAHIAGILSLDTQSKKSWRQTKPIMIKTYRSSVIIMMGRTIPCFVFGPNLNRWLLDEY